MFGSIMVLNVSTSLGDYNKTTMKQEDKTLAESILKHLCIGRRICGVNFYALPILLIDTTEGNTSTPEATLTIENGWSILNGNLENRQSFDFPKKAMNQESI